MKPPRQKSKADLQKIVDDFNERYKVGDPVLLADDDGVYHKRIVRAFAGILGGHTAVAFFEGISGCYLIEDQRVKPFVETTVESEST